LLSIFYDTENAAFVNAFVVWCVRFEISRPLTGIKGSDESAVKILLEKNTILRRSFFTD